MYARIPECIQNYSWCDIVHFLFLFLFTATYLGCYIDKNNRALPNHFTSSPCMTLEKCFAHCRSFGDQKYAGVQYSSECFCGDAMAKYNRYGKGNEAECNHQCTGNEEQICGGTWRNSVYNLGKIHHNCFYHENKYPKGYSISWFPSSI